MTRRLFFAAWRVRSRTLVGLGLTVAIVSVPLWWQWQIHIEATSRGETIARGRALYAQSCASCHGAELEGQLNWQSRKPDGRMPAPPHDATGHTWHHSDEQLFRIVKHGVEQLAPPGYKSDMPAYKDLLGDDDIRAVLAFIESRWPEQIRQRRREMPR